jgi:type II secretory pathway component PulF
MPFFRYSATDSSGKVVSGTLQAEDSGAARAALLRAGMSRVDLGGQSANAPIAHAAASRPPPARVQAAPGPAVVTENERGSDKDRIFLFSQLAAAFRSGINPAMIFNELSQKGPLQFRRSLADLAKKTGEGGLMSDVMARYPGLYPSSVVALTRAGESGGFVAEAFEETARQAESAHRFKRFFMWTWYVGLNALLSIPLVLIMTRALLAYWDAVDKSGGTGDSFAMLGRSIVAKLIWPWGPVTVVLYVGLWGLKRYFETDKMTLFRHRLGLKYPILGPRARQENFARFSWTLANLSRAGIPPARAWQMAAETVPNLAMRDLLGHAGTGWLEGREKLSDLIHRSGVFPPQYAPMVATAELTGDIPGAMDNLARMSNSEFEVATNMAKLRGGSWGCTLLFATGGIAMIIVCWFYYHELFNKVLDGIDAPGFLDWIR